ALFAGELTPVEQDEEKVTFSPNIKPEEERINWERSAREIANQIRGMRPWPVAHAKLDGERFKVWQATATDRTSNETPGSVVDWDKQAIYVACGQQTVLKLIEV